MATIPVVGTRWRCKDGGGDVEVEDVSYDQLGGWVVRAKLLDSEVLSIIAKAHWFTTEGYEHVPA